MTTFLEEAGVPRAEEPESSGNGLGAQGVIGVAAVGGGNGNGGGDGQLEMYPDERTPPPVPHGSAVRTPEEFEALRELRHLIQQKGLGAPAVRRQIEQLCDAATIYEKIYLAGGAGHRFLQEDIGVHPAVQRLGLELISEPQTDSTRLSPLHIVEFGSGNGKDAEALVKQLQGKRDVFLTAIDASRTACRNIRARLQSLLPGDHLQVENTDFLTWLGQKNAGAFGMEAHLPQWQNVVCLSVSSAHYMLPEDGSRLLHAWFDFLRKIRGQALLVLTTKSIRSPSWKNPPGRHAAIYDNLLDAKRRGNPATSADLEALVRDEERANGKLRVYLDTHEGIVRRAMDQDALKMQLKEAGFKVRDIVADPVDGYEQAGVVEWFNSTVSLMPR